MDHFRKWSLDGYICGIYIFKFIFSYLKEMSGKISNIICVSGNIGAGKTTYINSLKDSNNYVLLEEPLD